MSVRIDCQQLDYSYPTRNGSVVALKGVSVHLPYGEFVCVVGPSGCGKTTLLKLIAGVLDPAEGKILFEGLSDDGRPHCALSFQEHGVFPWMTVLDNVAFGLELRGVTRTERQARSRAFISRVGLEGFADHYPRELSVGMRQRVSIARAFLSDSPVLLMDEPFGSLDALTKLVLQRELVELWSRDRKLVVYVTHDIEEAVLLGDRVLVMSGRPGSIREEIAIDLPRPRDLLARMRPEILEYRERIWSLFQGEILGEGLGFPGADG